MRAASLVYDGADLRNHTYARYGHEVLKQPQQFADRFSMARSCTCSVDEYRMREVTRARAHPLEDLAPRLEGVDGQRLLETVRAFNTAMRRRAVQS